MFLVWILTEEPVVQSGLTGLTLLKTTKSGFSGYNKCDYTVLPETTDRLLSSIVDANWTYSTHRNVDFDRAWSVVLIIHGRSHATSIAALII